MKRSPRLTQGFTRTLNPKLERFIRVNPTAVELIRKRPSLGPQNGKWLKRASFITRLPRYHYPISRLIPNYLPTPLPLPHRVNPRATCAAACEAQARLPTWPLQDIVITNTVWCMVHFISWEGRRATCAAACEAQARLLTLAFTRYCFASKLHCGSLSSLYPPTPLAKPTLLQYYCTTIGQYTPSYRPPFCMP